QALTDAATEITDAQFGSFFYNVVNDRGESYTLYTLSGAPPEAFANFPMPRNTAIFGPTFRGDGVVRLEDVTKDERYGKSAPYHGMPRGHLPVRSYLAIPVVSRTGEVLGGLFFGHGEPGKFTSRHERLITGIAAQAAIALDNARLYEQAREAERQARDRARDLAEADRRKDHFLAVLSHELRNPLGAISNALHVMAATQADDPRFKRAHDVALRQVAQQRRLIDDLLDISRVARGKLQLRLESLDFRRLVTQAVADHQLALEKAGLRLSAEITETPIYVEGDGARLTQVVGNLLDNARKFTPAGGQVTVRLAAEGDTAVLTVSDTGCGIEPALLADLFTPFVQADRTLDRSQGGLGLGLALVRGLVELHEGGSIKASSEGLDCGTTFTIRLASQMRAKSDELLPISTSVRPGVRVVIIEDLPDLADTLCALLELYGCKPRVAHSGPAGIELARSYLPEVVLCDIGLPDAMSGYEVARLLRADPRTARARLIALTGYGASEDHRQSREAGFDLHLTKPVQPELLIAALRDLPPPPEGLG
ncbi:MAG TPA: ATP-binding protein, partial [Polyangia bacterium]